MTWIVCTKRKGRECRRPVAVCEKCRKRGKCNEFKQFEKEKKMTKKNDDQEKEYSFESVRHSFTEDEKRDIAIEMARKVAELNQAEDDKKAVMSDLKSKIDSLTAQVNGAASKLNSGFEYRSLKCEVDRDYKKRVILFWYDQRVVKEKPMSADDLQMKITD